MMVFYFSGLAIAAVAKAAQEVRSAYRILNAGFRIRFNCVFFQVVLEVRRQFRDNPDIMTFKSRPDYR
jgi:Na+/H+-translocating membrane pyrophosphatase